MTANLKFELRVAGSRGLDLGAGFFLRYYVSVGRHARRIRVEGQEIAVNEPATFECRGARNHVLELIHQGAVTFELRRRHSSSILRMFSKSELLGRGEVALEEVAGAQGMTVERWIQATGTGAKLPALLVEVRILEGGDGGCLPEEGWQHAEERDEGRCRGCRFVGKEEDMFAAAVAATAMVNDY